MLYKIIIEQLINYKWTCRTYVLYAPNNKVVFTYLKKKKPTCVFGDYDVIPLRRLKRVKKHLREKRLRGLYV